MNLTSPIEGGGQPKPAKKLRKGGTEGDFFRGGDEGNFGTNSSEGDD